MAEVFKNARAVLTTTMSTIYTCPPDTTALVIGSQLANVTAASKQVRVQWLDASNSNAVTRLLYDFLMPAYSPLTPISGKLALEAGDVVQAYSSVDNSVEMTLTVLEGI